MAFTSEAEGRWAAAWLRWPGYEPFWARLAWLAMRTDGDDEAFRAKRQRMAVGYPEELRIRPTNIELLKEIARATGGVFDPAPAEVFAPQGETVPRTTPLWPGLLAAAALLLVADVAIRRYFGKVPLPGYGSSPTVSVKGKLR